MKKISQLVLPGVFLLAAACMAADQKNQYSAKSVATLNCQHFLASRQKGGEAYALYGGFIGGYITAYNQYVATTFDITPWQDTDTVAGMLARYCDDNPEERFGRVIARLLMTLKPERLHRASESIQVTNGSDSITVHRQVLNSIVDRLVVDGFYTGELGKISDHKLQDEKLKAALIEFQKTHALAPTGLPDQQTLFRIFYR